MLKRLLPLFLALLFSYTAGAQTYKEIGGTGQVLNGLMARELLLPDDTVLTKAKNVDTCQQIAKKSGVLYSYNCDTHSWVKLLDGNFKALDSARWSNDTLFLRQALGGEIAIKITGLPQANIIGLSDSLTNRPTFTQADVRYIRAQTSILQPGPGFSISGNGIIGNTFTVGTGTVGSSAPLEVGTLPSYGGLSAKFNGTVQGVSAVASSEFTTLQQNIDSNATNTLQKVTQRGNSTLVNILAGGGIDVSSGNLLIGTLPSTSRVRINRFLDLYGQSTGVANGAFVSFYKSDGTRIAAMGDGASWDNNLYTSINSNFDYRIVNSSGQLNTDPSRIAMTITGYSDSAKVLIGDSASGIRIYPYIRHSVRGNALVYNTQNNAAFTEYSDGDSIYISVGKLGQPEANVSMNMDYNTRVHRLYKTSIGASWMALGATAGAIQYAAATSAPGDVWTASGSPYALYWTHSSLNNAKVAINTNAASPSGDANLLVKRSSSMPSITGYDDIVIDGHRTKGTAGVVFLNAYNTGNVIIASGGGQTVVGGATANSTLTVNGSISLPIRTVTANRTLDATDYTIRATVSGITLTLPGASACTGRVYVLVNYNSGGNITTSAFLNNGVSTTTIATGVKVWLQSDGSNWYQIN